MLQPTGGNRARVTWPPSSNIDAIYTTATHVMENKQYSSDTVTVQQSG
jgi:hypothetical protein